MALPAYQPMLATRWEAVTDEPGWIHEMKWDGVRAIVSGDGAIRSRNGNRIEAGYPELAGVVPGHVIVDGEIVALDEEGRPSFQTLQSRMHVRRPPRRLVADTPVTYVAFDVLYEDEPLLQLPWEDRRRRLEALDLGGPVVLSDIHHDGSALFSVIRDHGLEGIVSKRRASVYRPGRRSEDWRKNVNRHSCEAVVVGSLKGTGGRASTFGSLALAMWSEDGRLRYVGAVGSGFDAESVEAIDRAMSEMAIDRPPPLDDPEAVPKPVRWVSPSLVAVVEYASWTGDGRLRAPVFKGFSATPVEEVTWEREGPT